MTYVQSTKLDNLYINGLQISGITNTTVTVQPGICRDSTNSLDLTIGNYLASNAAAVTVNTAVSGVNGLDTGSLANNTWYYLYVIGDQSNFNNASLVLSASLTAPTLPNLSRGAAYSSGYSSWRRIGAVKTDGSAHILPMYQLGSSNIRKNFWDVPIAVLTAGVATSYASLDCSPAVPPIQSSTEISLLVALTPNTAGDTVSLRGTGSTGPQIVVTGVVAAKVQEVQVSLPALISSSLPKIDYQVTSGSDAVTLSVTSWNDYL